MFSPGLSFSLPMTSLIFVSNFLISKSDTSPKDKDSIFTRENLSLSVSKVGNTSSFFADFFLSNSSLDFFKLTSNVE